MKNICCGKGCALLAKYFLLSWTVIFTGLTGLYPENRGSSRRLSQKSF
jgi:hypothetical protein